MTITITLLLTILFEFCHGGYVIVSSVDILTMDINRTNTTDGIVSFLASLRNFAGAGLAMNDVWYISPPTVLLSEHAKEALSPIMASPNFASSSSDSLVRK
jgi:hypothetical protein